MRKNTLDTEKKSRCYKCFLEEGYSTRLWDVIPYSPAPTECDRCGFVGQFVKTYSDQLLAELKHKWRKYFKKEVVKDDSQPRAA